MKEEIIKNITKILEKNGTQSPFNVLNPIENSEMGDYYTNVAMVFAKKIGKNSLDFANEIKKDLDSLKINGISKIEVVGNGYINFSLDKEFFAETIKEIIKKKDDFGKSDHAKGYKVFIEHTQPNPFKEFHIGHLMNNAIGESVARIVKANGAEVQTATYHGDVGLHIAKAVWALKRNIPFANAYSEGHKAYEDGSAKTEILEINKKIYDESDPDINEIYDKGRGQSLSFFEDLYKKLDSHFDYHFFESESGEVGKEIVLENIGKIFEKGDEGAVIFRGENFEPKTHTRVFLNKEGLPTYEAKELGLAQIKKDFFEYDASVTITANEQDSFFKVVEVAIGEVFPELKGKLKHLSHGLLKLSTGKMSSREGNVVSAESLINQVKEKILEKIKDREFSKTEEENVSEIIAIGAIKYSILRQAIGGDIIFDFDRSISFEGDSGPYLQYSVVRANSLLKKAEGVVVVSDELPKNWQTTNLERLLERFPKVVSRAGMEYAPHHIVTYLIDLAGEFNSFYAGGKIIDEKDETSPYRLALTKAFAQVMTYGLNLLGIKVPEKM